MRWYECVAFWLEKYRRVNQWILLRLISPSHLQWARDSNNDSWWFMGGVEKSLARRRQSNKIYDFMLDRKKMEKALLQPWTPFLDSRLSTDLLCTNKDFPGKSGRRRLNMLLADRSARQYKPFTWQRTLWSWCTLKMPFLSWISRPSPHPFVRFMSRTPNEIQILLNWLNTSE